MPCIFRRVVKYIPNACSDTDSTFALGQLLTTIPRFLHASRSTQSVPVAMMTMYFKCGVTSGERVTASILSADKARMVASRTRACSSESFVR